MISLLSVYVYRHVFYVKLCVRETYIFQIRVHALIYIPASAIQFINVYLFESILSLISIYCFA